MLTIEYNEKGKSIRDAKIDKFIKGIKVETENNLNNHILVANELVLFAIRAAIAKKELDHTKIQFKHKDQFLPINEYGRIANWPSGFCSNFDKYLDDLFFVRIKEGEQTN